MDVQNRRVSATRLHSMIGPLVEEGPAYASLARGIRRLVTNGRMLHGTVLPSERELVTELGLSRTTVSRAYSELRDRGFATARQGSGTVITVPGGPAAGGQEPMPDGGVELEAAGRHAVDLTCAAPSAPVGMVEHYEAAMAQLPAYISGMGYFPLGLPELRNEIAQLYRRRGLETSPEQIVVTNGALAGFAAVIRAVLPPGSRVLAESPSYPNTIASLRHHGARVSAVPIGPEGTDLEAVGQALRRVQPAAMLCLPDFHNPTGTLLDNEGRERWAWQLDAAKTVGIVDETAVDLWWDAEPDVKPMAIYSDRIVSIGSASKSHWGGLRLGWLRCPRSLQGAVTTMRTSLDLGAPVLEQLVLTRMLQTGNGLPGESRTRIRTERDWLHATLSEQLPGWKANVPPGGLSLWWNLPAPRSTALAEAAARHGVLLAPGSVFAVEDHGLEHWIRTPFALAHEELERAVPGIVAAWHEVA
ncbi:PLP-dependent aminotransferase family protein [Arthrobacter crystallopoietes]|uniref:MocR-like transcription factor YczR n=1 Tax=Crystallibacter crystallopoietes TaxID=37928 RepID=UPI001ABEBCB9|nr:PLP-dependent aminotransferase family protein [Arthrobacter crystallopoietes]QTG82622.1 PLP-dependent aminotransferase family protein [Arthrobacter crystallopoietes]